MQHTNGLTVWASCILTYTQNLQLFTYIFNNMAHQRGSQKNPKIQFPRSFMSKVWNGAGGGDVDDM